MKNKNNEIKNYMLFFFTLVAVSISVAILLQPSCVHQSYSNTMDQLNPKIKNPLNQKKKSDNETITISIDEYQTLRRYKQRWQKIIRIEQDKRIKVSCKRPQYDDKTEKFMMMIKHEWINYENVAIKSFISVVWFYPSDIQSGI